MDDFIEKFEAYIIDNNGDGIFKTYIEIEEITGYDIRDIIKFIDGCDDFRRNSNMEWTTLKLYTKYRGFWNKFLDINAMEIR